MPLIVKLVLIGVERDLVEQDLGVGERVERDADPADLLLDVGVVGVVAALRREVERDREAGAALREQVAVALVRLLGRAEARVLADRPRGGRGSPSGKLPAGEGELARRRDRVRRAGGRPARSSPRAGCPASLRTSSPMRASVSETTFSLRKVTRATIIARHARVVPERCPRRRRCPSRTRPAPAAGCASRSTPGSPW